MVIPERNHLKKDKSEQKKFEKVQFPPKLTMDYSEKGDLKKDKSGKEELKKTVLNRNELVNNNYEQEHLTNDKFEKELSGN